ncbi:MAG: extracellular solute-binding protein [Spirochaetaceae bacterium]|nr:extracellular solute-binding protein [Spirochaetaceae bacterium]
MRKGNMVFCWVLLAVTLVSAPLFAGGKKEPAGGPVDLSGLSMEQLIAGAKKEGRIESVGMPDDWADWGSSWKALNEKYGLTHFDTNMSSAEEIAIFKAEADSPTKDIGDVGHAYGKIAIAEDVVQGYKPSTWDSIPDWAKDPDGRWILSYTGTMAFIYNPQLTGGPVRSWADVAKGSYKVSVGDVIGGASSQVMVISAAIANGGGLSNVRPGIEFFKTLAKAGRIDPANGQWVDRLSRGEIALAANNYDFRFLGFREQVRAVDSKLNLEVGIPQDGAVTSGYCLIFNKYSPHPHAAALTIEYLLSDEGQIDRARGLAKPIRDIPLPPDVQARVLPGSQYGNTTPVADVNVLSAACSEVARLWEAEVLPLMQ